VVTSLSPAAVTKVLNSPPPLRPGCSCAWDIQPRSSRPACGPARGLAEVTFSQSGDDGEPGCPIGPLGGHVAASGRGDEEGKALERLIFGQHHERRRPFNSPPSSCEIRNRACRCPTSVDQIIACMMAPGSQEKSGPLG
jgi:hypothetical protein